MIDLSTDSVKVEENFFSLNVFQSLEFDQEKKNLKNCFHEIKPRLGWPHHGQC